MPDRNAIPSRAANRVGPRSATTEPFPEPEWEFTTEPGTIWMLPFYPCGYLAGWRDAMLEAKGGDWSNEFPAWWPNPPGEATL